MAKKIKRKSTKRMRHDRAAADFLLFTSSFLVFVFIVLGYFYWLHFMR